MPFVIVPVGVNDGHFQAIHQPNRVNPQFSVLETIIDPLNSGSIENVLCILKSDLMAFDIAAVPLWISSVSHLVYLHNVNMLCKPFSSLL